MTLVNLELRQQVELLLRLPAEARARFLLDAPKPMALVRALPDGEFYLTAREIGPQGALALLALASASQIAHLLDLESWRRDRFDPLRSGSWVALLVGVVAISAYTASSMTFAVNGLERSTSRLPRPSGGLWRFPGAVW
jgi:hypothetical protein